MLYIKSAAKVLKKNDMCKHMKIKKIIQNVYIYYVYI